MESERQIAIGAEGNVPAVAADLTRSAAPPAKIEQRLPAIGDSGCNGIKQLLSNIFTRFEIIFVAQVDYFAFGKGNIIDSAWEQNVFNPVLLCEKQLTQTRGCGSENESCGCETGAAGCHGNGMIARVLILLVAGLVALLNYDKAQIVRRHKETRPGADDYPWLVIGLGSSGFNPDFMRLVFRSFWGVGGMLLP